MALGAWALRFQELLVGGELEFVMAKMGSEGWEPMFGGPEIFTTLQGCKVMDYCYQLEDDMQKVGVDLLTTPARHFESSFEAVGR